MHLTPEESCESFSWSDGSDPGYIKAEGYTEGSATVSMGDVGTTGDAVSIGAWTANNKYLDLLDKGADIQSVPFIVGDIAVFSSWGVDYAGHKFPDACTPGIRISAAINSMMTASDLKNETISALGKFPRQFKGQSEPYSLANSALPSSVCNITILWGQAPSCKNNRGASDGCPSISFLKYHYI